MNSLTDQQLLRDYSRHRSEAAFAEIVRRHINLVYSAALRMVRDAHLAEDVTQGAFVALAQQAHHLTDRPVLSGWLHRTAQNLAANAVRSEVRRRTREQEAAAMNELLANESDATWENIAPYLDAALGELNEADRDTLLLRFFEQKSAREMAQILDTSEAAAQKRVGRAIERLREYFSKRNVTIGASGLVVLISANAVQSAPAGLAAAISTAAVAVAGTTAATSTVIAATKTIAMTTLQKIIIGTALTAAIGTGIFEAHRAAQLRDRNQTLQQQQTSLAEQVRQLQQQRDDAQKRLALLSAKPAPHLPAPSIQFSAATNLPVAASTPTNLFAVYDPYKDKPPILTAAQVGAYLKANGTNAASLLAAFRASGDPALLQEAMVKYPNDPQVAFEAVFDKNLTPKEQRQWLNAFEQDAPDNALPNYLSALNYFNSGQIDKGIQALAAAAGKGYDDYTLNRMQNDVEAYLSAGYSEAEAEVVADSSLELWQAKPLKQLGKDLVALGKAYNQAGDPNSAQSALQMAVDLGQTVANKSPTALLQPLEGMSIETLALNAMNPNSAYGNNGQTVQDQLKQIAQNQQVIHEVALQAEPLWPKMSNQDWINYENRRMLFGELAAMQWLVNKYGQQ